MGEFFHLMFNQRQKDDYEDMFVYDNEQLSEWLPEAEEFVEILMNIK